MKKKKFTEEELQGEVSTEIEALKTKLKELESEGEEKKFPDYVKNEEEAKAEPAKEKVMTNWESKAKTRKLKSEAWEVVNIPIKHEQGLMNTETEEVLTEPFIWKRIMNILEEMKKAIG